MTGQEDYRVRNAREGRAFYNPGRTAAQVRAEREAEAAARARMLAFTLTLSQGEWDALDTALPDAVELIRDAGEVFRLLADEFTRGHIDPGQPGVACLMRLAARGLHSAEDREIAAVERLDDTMRRQAQSHREEVE